MRFKPISEAEAADAGLWKRGIYDFEVLDAKDRVSAKGNDMIEVNLKLYDNEGRTFRLFDYLVNSEGMAFKIRHFASATGMLPLYEAGQLEAGDCVGKAGRCQVGIEKAKNGYPAKNTVQDYVPLVPGAPLIKSVAPEDEPDDEIPF